MQVSPDLPENTKSGPQSAQGSPQKGIRNLCCPLQLYFLIKAREQGLLRIVPLVSPYLDLV